MKTTLELPAISLFNSKQQAFLDFVLSQYVKVGVHELDKVFVGFQRFLYITAA